MAEAGKEEKIEDKKSKEKKKEDTEIEKLNITIKEKDGKLKEAVDILQRIQAEFENHAKRVENEKKEIRKYAEAELIKKLLPVLDSFELALKNNHNCSAENAKLIKGMEMIYAQLFDVLEDEGLRKIEAVGKRFDPYCHEVLIVGQDCKKDDDCVVEELQKGFLLNGRVLRYSKVKINKKSEDAKHEDKC